jgi:pimeloyl-ACP methyl ester carboxylesterase
MTFLADQWPAAKFEVVASANHLLPVTHPELFGALLQRELAE